MTAFVNIGGCDVGVAGSFQAQASGANPPNQSPRMAITREQSNGARKAFRWESEMTPLVSGSIDRLLPTGAEPHIVVPEVQAAIGIVDLLAVRFDGDALRLRGASGVGPICLPLRIRVLDALRDGRWRRGETIARLVGSNWPALRRSTLAPLAEAGLIEIDSNRIRSTLLWLPLASELTAIELKLSKWQGALRQANNFARSADRSWVVVDANYSRPATDQSELFRECGVGLATLTPEGRLSVVVRPRRRRPIRWLRALIAERALAGAEQPLF